MESAKQGIKWTFEKISVKIACFAWLFTAFVWLYALTFRPSSESSFSETTTFFMFVCCLYNWSCTKYGYSWQVELYRSFRDSNIEGIASGLGFLLPRKIRRDVFEPFFEELKEDRLEELAVSGSKAVKHWIGCCFYFRLLVTFLQSLLCWAGDVVGKAAPFLKGLFFKGGS